VIARQIPDDSYWPEVILSPQIKYFLDDLSGRLVGRIFRNRFGILQASFTMLLVCITPSIKTGPADPKIPASFADVADLLGMLEHFKFALNVAFFVRHEYFPHPKSGNLQEVSRESVHIYTAAIGKRVISASVEIFMFLAFFSSFIHRVLEHPTFDGLTSDRRTIQLTA